MGVEIHFLGALLFVGTKDRLNSVLLPNGEIQPDWVGGERRKELWRHPDGEVARVHYAGMTIVRKSNPKRPEFVSLSGQTTVSIGGTSGVPISAAVQEMIPNLTGRTLESTRNSLASTVTLGGHATVSGSGAEERRYTFSGRARFYLGLKVAFPDAQLAIVTTGTGDPSSINVDEGDYIAIYNYDYPHPSCEQLATRNPILCENGEAIDHDFKWIYSLFDDDNTYLAPSARCGGLRSLTPHVSSCFSAGYWGSDTEEPT